MKTIFLSGSKVGSKTLTSMKKVQAIYQQKYPEHETLFLDLKEFNIEFSIIRHKFIAFPG